jgi:hypothetical protein
MEEGVGEPEGGVVHAGGQHWHQPSRGVGGEAAALRPVEDRHESSDGCGEQDPTGPQDSPRIRPLACIPARRSIWSPQLVVLVFESWELAVESMTVSGASCPREARLIY